MELFDLLREAAPTLIKGCGYTLLFALSAMVGGSVLGFPLAIARVLPARVLPRVAAVYVSLMRGTPLLVQVFVIYYGLPSIGIEFSPVVAGTLALSLNAGAYLSETLRGALIGVSRDQWAAGFSLGLSYGQTLRHIVLPQAMRVAVPGMSNTLIS